MKEIFEVWSYEIVGYYVTNPVYDCIVHCRTDNKKKALEMVEKLKEEGRSYVKLSTERRSYFNLENI